MGRMSSVVSDFLIPRLGGIISLMIWDFLALGCVLFLFLVCFRVILFFLQFWTLVNAASFLCFQMVS